MTSRGCNGDFGDFRGFIGFRLSGEGDIFAAAFSRKRCILNLGETGGKLRFVAVWSNWTGGIWNPVSCPNLRLIRVYEKGEFATTNSFRINGELTSYDDWHFSASVQPNANGIVGGRLESPLTAKEIPAFAGMECRRERRAASVALFFIPSASPPWSFVGGESKYAAVLLLAKSSRFRQKLRTGFRLSPE